MNKINKIILSIAIITSIYILTVSIFAIKQHYTIQILQDKNADYQRVIADYKKDLNTPEYMAFDKCKGQGKWLGECIAWELGK